MSVINFDITTDLPGHSGMQPHFNVPTIPPSAVRTDKRHVFPRFYVEARRNEAKSKQMGMPQYDEVELVEFLIAGDAKSGAVSKVTDKIREEYADQYTRWKNSHINTVEGMPVQEMPGLSATQVALLKAMNVLSVEQLANVADTFLPAIGMGARELRAKARAYIDTSRSHAAVMEQAAENARLKEMIALLTQQMQDVQRRVDTAAALGVTNAPVFPQTQINSQTQTAAPASPPTAWQMGGNVQSMPAPVATPPWVATPPAAFHPAQPAPIPQEAAPKRKGGWPKGKPRGPSVPRVPADANMAPQTRLYDAAPQDLAPIDSTITATE